MASSKKNYHVFLSFRGTDVRNNFLSHLYANLNWNGIHTFKDSEELWKGEEISPALMKAIKESRVAIIILSKDYASSRWCLEELAKIMEYKARKELIVLPVFYKVKPGEVRGLSEGYGTAMERHKSEGRDPETVERWKNALVSASNLAGCDYNNEDEAEFIQGIVKQVSNHLERTTPLYVAKYPVGIDSRVQEVISLLQKESDGDDVLMIRIWGPGGIGKTAIASAIYNAIEREFEGSCFLDRVDENSNKSGLVELQRKILSQILSPGHLEVSSQGKGCSLIRERLCHKKVLLVLDDVCKQEQLDTLAGGGDWFGKGSRIFVTTRDKSLVISSHCKNLVYPVKILNNREALELFERHAFQNSKKSEIRKDLIDRALHYARGLPLALEVLGSNLRDKDESVWKSKLNALSNCPGKGINQILQISFDGLENNEEKEIFLDIACFFKGIAIYYIKKVLDSCDFKTTTRIETLIDKSLIRYENGTVQMHDLVQLMGKNIVMQHNLGQRSRLWLFTDVLDILCEEKGSKEIQAIVVDSLTPEETNWSHEEITIEADAFKKMTNMRMLILPEVHISSEGCVRLPSSLRWLEWPNAPLPKFGSGPKKLVGLSLQKSSMRQLGDTFKHFRWLKYINFSECKSLVSVPDFSSAPNLECLNLNGCKSLEELHQSVACLDKLEFLSLQFCCNLSIFPNILKTKSLRALDLFGCSKLKKFSDIPEKMEHLEELDLGGTAITELPESVENLLSLKVMSLRKCKKLTTLPSGVYKWQNLEHLDLLGCSDFATFPKNSEDSNNPNGNPGFQKLKILELAGCNLSEVEFLESSSSFPKLGFLDLSRNKFTHLPTCIIKYKCLQHLYVDKCKQIQKIPQLPPNVHVLSAECCKSLQEFPDLSSLSSDCCWIKLSSCRKLCRKGANMAHALSPEGLPKMRTVDILLPGREMPEWLLHCESSIVFIVRRELYDKFLGLAISFVLGPEEGKPVYVFVQVEIVVNGQTVKVFTRGMISMEFDHVWMGYLPVSQLGTGRKRLRGDCSHIQVKFVPETGARLKKCGACPIWEQQEDQRIKAQPCQPMEIKCPPLEESDSEEDNWMATEEEESSSETDDELIKAIDQEKEKQGLFKADKIGPSDERDSEEDNWKDTEEEESSSETDDELTKAIDPENERTELYVSHKIVFAGTVECEATNDICRSVKTFSKEQFLRNINWRYRF